MIGLYVRKDPSFFEQRNMKEDHPSGTAIGVSVLRAFHQLFDEFPRILEDPVSPLLLTAEMIENMRSDRGRFQTVPARGLRSHVVLRSRYAEDELRATVKDGLDRFVSLGAGFDTFPFRQPDWAEGLSIVEVDHPATQKAKQELFARQRIPFPGNTAFIPLDLEKGDLGESLLTGGNKPVFVSCLGVLAYLTLGTARRIFGAIGRMPTGSRMALAFAPQVHEGGDQRAGAAAEHAAALGEPWQTYFTEDDLRNELTRGGFHRVTFLRADDAADRYYHGRTDLPAPKRTRLCIAEV